MKERIFFNVSQIVNGTWMVEAYNIRRNMSKKERKRKLFDGKVYYIFKVFEMIYRPNASEYIYIYFFSYSFYTLWSTE